MTWARGIAGTLATLAAVAGCGAQAAPASGKIRMVLVQGLAGDEFAESMACGARRKAAELGAELRVRGPRERDPAAQRKLVETVVAGGPDAILIAPAHAQALAAPLAQARERGIKIILVAAALDDQSIGLSRIGTDNDRGGVAAAKALAAQIGDSGKVLVVSTAPGAAPADARVRGFEQEIRANHALMTHLGVRYSHDAVAEATKIVTAALARDPDLAGVFATTLNAATGAGAALRTAGRLGTVKMVGFDAGAAQVEQLKDGVVQALVAQLPGEIGARGVEQAVAAVRGEPVTSAIPTDAAIVTKADLDTAAGRKLLYKPQC
ncbi:substrate-binding domain-containing protein [Nonomuraea sp. NPDC046570]|uniref:substrate-binding domain-containing protein n=1 Tax=Nonomuraea sp. NPDC046570 TaxID=3155255 RepID=UPI0033F17A9F